MTRIYGFILAILSALTSTSATEAQTDSHQCRCMPTDPCWPSQQEWIAFNKTVQGNLIATVPIASACHDSTFGPYDEAKCDALKVIWGYPETYIASPSQPMYPFFANLSCDPFTSPDAHCIVGTLVQYTVNATSTSHIKTTISFAQRKNIRLVIRNTGHDYNGKSAYAPGGLALWTHHMKDMHILDYHSNIYKGKALKVGAGISGEEAQNLAHARGLVVVTGNCPTVGITGGYAQGGGHSPVSSKFSLAADQVLEWEVITSTGKHLIATPDRYPDLYWALSGGGGGTYGIVVSITIRAHADLPTSAAKLAFSNHGVSNDTFYEGVKMYLMAMPNIVDAGAVSVLFLTEGKLQMEPVTAPGVSKADLQKILDAMLTTLKNLGITYDFHIDEFPTYLDCYEAYTPRANISENNTESRLIPQTMLSNNASVSAITDVFRYVVTHGGLVIGVSLNVFDGAKVPNSVHPLWRLANTHTVLGIPYDLLDFQNNIDANERLLNDFMPRLDAVLPVQAAYLNEADASEPDWQNVFYGSNYNILKSIKNKYDPSSTWYGQTAVGSDDWAFDHHTGRLCRV
ncbi:FAD-linked oxidoreductase sor8 [Cladobotryum mycophilum]|uniref:FAD-linked oxidoreductase sor8 n=1 Tax=Cladobotryum mycophilum TaxID=491253 RepID=A0ABR0SJV7_9HYPO